MRKKFIAFLLVFAILLGFVPGMTAYAAGATVQNPFMWADVPDLDVIRVGNTYYMSSTTMHMNPGVPIMKSKDLVNWEIVNYVYDILGASDKQALVNGESEYGKGSWASSLRYHNGKYYVAFPSYTAGKTYIYQTTDIERGPWTYSALEGVYHDLSLLFDDDGRVYMVYGGGDIRAIELTADATAIKAGGLDKVIIPNASLVASTVENVGLPAEGTHIQKINGKYYVFNIAWPKNSGRVELVHRADSIDGVYTGKVALNNQGVAQGGIVDTPDGKWYGLLFGDRGSVGRIPYLVPVTWEDGWPIFGDVTDTGIHADNVKFNIVQSDEFNQRADRIGAYHTVVTNTTPVTTAPSTPLDPGEGKEVLVNGGFENGLTSWSSHDGATLSVTDAVYNSGEHSLLVTGRTGIASGPQQVLTGKLTAGHIYHFSAKVRYDAEAAPAVKEFHIDFQDGDWTTIKIMGSKTIAKGQWGTIEGTYTIPAGTTLNQPLIFFETPWVPTPDPNNDLMDFHVDDVSFVDITPDTNIIKNGGFENGTTSWTSHDGAVLSVTGAVYNSGEHSLLVTGRTGIASGPQQVLTGKLTAGHKYHFSAKVRYDAELAPATKEFHIDFQDGDWTTIRIMGSGIITKGQWGTIEGDYTIPAGTTLDQPLIFFETPWVPTPDPNNDLMDFYVDDISITDITPTDYMQPIENEYNGSNLALVWQWNHNPDNTNWSLTDRTGYLRLATGRTSQGINDAKNTLTQRTFGPECSGNIAIDTSHMKDGDYAGLAAFQNHYGFVGVKMSGTSKSIIMMTGTSMVDGTTPADGPDEIASVPITQDRVYLKIDFDYKNQTDKAYFYYSLDGASWIKIGDTLQMGYSLTHFMGYRFGLFNYATKTAGGYVDFDYFRVNNRMTGTEATTVLTAGLQDVSNVMGVQNVELAVPIKMDPLPAGTYTAIAASFNVPKYLTVTGVDFNTANVVGTTSYTFSNNQLKLTVSGGSVNFTNNASDNLFATIKLKVTGYVPVDTTEQITTNYINVEGGSVVYEVSSAIANIGLKALNTGAIAKLPGYSNPLMDHKLGADPFAMVYDGRIYIYMSSDEYERDGDGNITENHFNNLNRIFVISSSDMVNWTDHGAIPVAGYNNANNGQGIAKWAGLSWAPAAAHKTINGKEKFFLYFANGAGGIGVLTSDSPIGPWTDPTVSTEYPNGHALITGDTPGAAGVTWLFDPAVLVDDDGTGYLYFGGGIPNDQDQTSIANPETARVIELGDDMTSTVGSASMIDAPFMFEDSGIHKYNGKYYYSYCFNFSGSHPEDKPAGEIAYMMSDSPMGPFTYTGHFLKNPYEFFGVGGNNHHAVFQFNGQWYVVYHAQTVSKALIGDGKGYRSPHINKLEYYSNGQIKEVQGDREGIAQIANLDPYKRTEAETIAWNKGISTEKSAALGNPVESINLDVTNIDNGDWIAVSNANFGEKGAKAFKANVAATAGGKIEIHLDSPAGELVGTLDVSPTGGAQNWQTVETNVTNVKGNHSIFLVFTGTGTNLFNLDYWQFTTAADTTPVKPFTISDAELTRTGGIQASVNVSPTQGEAAHSGQEVVLFQLMRGNTPVSIVALKKDITSQESFKAYFNVDPNEGSYTVRVYVLNSFTNDLSSAPESLAEWVTLQ